MFMLRLGHRWHHQTETVAISNAVWPVKVQLPGAEAVMCSGAICAHTSHLLHACGRPPWYMRFGPVCACLHVACLCECGAWGTSRRRLPFLRALVRALRAGLPAVCLCSALGVKLVAVVPALSCPRASGSLFPSPCNTSSGCISAHGPLQAETRQYGHTKCYEHSLQRPHH